MGGGNKRQALLDDAGIDKTLPKERCDESDAFLAVRTQLGLLHG